MARLVKELRRFGRDTMGASAVEFAFVIPALMLLIVGTLDGGRAMLAVNQIAKISKEGARYASVHGSEAAVPATQASVTDFVAMPADSARRPEQDGRDPLVPSHRG